MMVTLSWYDYVLLVLKPHIQRQNKSDKLPQGLTTRLTERSNYGYRKTLISHDPLSTDKLITPHQPGGHYCYTSNRFQRAKLLTFFQINRHIAATWSPAVSQICQPDSDKWVKSVSLTQPRGETDWGAEVGLMSFTFSCAAHISFLSFPVLSLSHLHPPPPLFLHVLSFLLPSTSLTTRLFRHQPAISPSPCLHFPTFSS